MKKLMIAAAGAVAMACTAFSAVEDWFNANIEDYDSWPADATLATGGTWSSNTDVATLKGGALEIETSSDPLTFTMTSSKMASKDDPLNISSTVAFTAYEELPTPPDGAKAAVIAVKNDEAEIDAFYVLGKDPDASTNIWFATEYKTTATQQVDIVITKVDDHNLNVAYSFGESKTVEQVVYVSATQITAASYSGNGAVCSLAGTTGKDVPGVTFTITQIDGATPTVYVDGEPVDEYFGTNGAPLRVVYKADDGKIFKNGTDTFEYTGKVAEGTINTGVDGQGLKVSPAMCDGAYCYTVQAAFDAAGAESYIMLMTNVTENSVTLAAGKEATFDLNDWTLTATTWGIRNYGTLTITDGGENGDGAIVAQEGAVNIYSNSVTTIDGGTFTANDNAVVMGNGKPGEGGCTLTINGGTFNSNIKTAGYIACGVYVPNSGTYEILGGTFNVDNGCGVCARAGTTYIGEDVVINLTNPGEAGWVGDKKSTVPCVAAYFDWTVPPYPGYAEGDTIKSQTQFTTAAGQKWSDEADENGYYSLEQVVEGTVLLISGTTTNKYETIAAALAEVAAGDTIALTADLAEAVAYTGTVDFTLDLNGKTLTDSTADATLKNNGSGTITVADSVGTGKIYNGSSADGYGIALYSRLGAIVVNGGNFENNTKYEATATAGHAALTINGGTFKNLCAEAYPWKTEWSKLALNRVNSWEGVLTVTGGTFSSDPAQGDDSGVQTTFLAANYESVKDGDYWKVQEKPAGTVLLITDNGVTTNTYATVQAAMDASKAGDTVALTQDTELTECLMVTNFNGTLDLGGFELANAESFTKALGGSYLVMVGGTEDSKTAFTVKNGTITVKDGLMFDVYSDSTMTVAADATIDTIATTSAWVFRVVGRNYDGSASQNLATLNVYGTMTRVTDLTVLSSGWQQAVVCVTGDGNAVLNVYDGAVMTHDTAKDAESGGRVIAMSGAGNPTVNIYGGTLTAGNSTGLGYLLHAYASGTNNVRIEGGTFNMMMLFSSNVNGKVLNMSGLGKDCTARFSADKSKHSGTTTVTSLCDEGYKLKKSKEDNYYHVVAIDYATLTITPVDNCTIAVSNGTAAVESGAKFDKDNSTVLTVYRTPAAGYELVGCEAVEQITMTADQTVTATVKSTGVKPGEQQVLPVEKSATQEEAQEEAAKVAPQAANDEAAAAGQASVLKSVAVRDAEGNWVVEAQIDETKIVAPSNTLTVVADTTNMAKLIAAEPSAQSDAIQLTNTQVTPGLYYSIGAQTSLDANADVTEGDRQLATSAGVTLTATKPAGTTDKCFFKVLVNTNPKPANE